MTMRVKKREVIEKAKKSEGFRNKRNPPEMVGPRGIEPRTPTVSSLLSALVFALFLAAFFIVPPEHTLNPHCLYRSKTQTHRTTLEPWRYRPALLRAHYCKIRGCSFFRRSEWTRATS